MSSRRQTPGTDRASLVVRIVEDDPEVRRAIGRVLRAVGLSGVEYASPREALDDCGRRSVACQILDVDLPGITGIELYEQLVHLGSGTPTIFISGDPAALAAARRAVPDAVAYLDKPFEAHALSAAVESATRSRHELSRRLPRTDELPPV